MASQECHKAESPEQVRVFLWAVPRSVSTAMTKCMSFVDGVQIWNEPYLCSYHNEKFASNVPGIQKLRDLTTGDGMQHVMKVIEETPRGKRIDNDSFNFPWVKSQLETQDPDKKLIFIKDMAHVMNKRYEYLPASKKFRHTFLIREPISAYTSWFNIFALTHVPDGPSKSEIIKTFSEYLYDIDRIYEYTYDLWKYTKEHLDPDAIIIDGTELVAQPDKLLPKYFEAIGVPYREDYLNWDANSDIITEWKASFLHLISCYMGGVFTTAIDSTSFTPERRSPPSLDSLSPDLLRCVEAAQPYYDEMYAQRLIP